MRNFLAFLLGIIFGFGLLLSEMANPAKVQSFLDIAGNWDYSLAFVMGGALLVALIGFQFSKHREHSLLGVSFPTFTKNIDKHLIFGSALFGIGWGIAGVCPAPALILLSLGTWQGLVFVIAMLVGMFIFQKLPLKN